MIVPVLYVIIDPFRNRNGTGHLEPFWNHFCVLGQKLVPKFLLRKGAFEISPTLEPLQNFDHIMDTYQ